jgi:DNA-directed RNA polymerase subunit RPC12/RpoP
MREYKCSKCGGLQYSSSAQKENEPCVYCGYNRTELQGDEIKQDKK